MSRADIGESRSAIAEKMSIRYVSEFELETVPARVPMLQWWRRWPAHSPGRVTWRPSHTSSWHRKSQQAPTAGSDREMVWLEAQIQVSGCALSAADEHDTTMTMVCGALGTLPIALDHVPGTCRLSRVASQRVAEEACVPVRDRNAFCDTAAVTDLRAPRRKKNCRIHPPPGGETHGKRRARADRPLHDGVSSNES